MAALLLVSLIPVEPILALGWTAVALLVGACVVREDNGLAPFLKFRPLAFIGVISYGMYLFNTLCVRVVHAAMDRVGWGHPLAALAPTVALTVLTAWLSYRFFEMPFLTLKSRFSRQPRAAVPGIAPVPALARKVAVASTNS